VVGETLVVVEHQVTSKSICLILPPSPWLISDTDLPFLGPLYLSSYLKDKGFDVTVMDLSGENLSDWWPKEHFDVWGITGTSPNFPQMKIIAGRIKTVDPKALIVAGGAHATMAPKHLLRNSAVDIVVEGPGEKKLENVLNGFKYDIDPNDYKIAPIPDYEAIDFKKYLPSQTFKYLLGEVNEATILTTLGCPYRCNFCGQHNMRSKIKFIPLPDIEKNIDHLISRYQVKLFYVLDDTFGFAKGRLKDLCALFKKKDIRWHCLLRADLATRPRLEMMRESGCIGIVYGFESGSNRILKLMNKGTTAQQNYEAARNTWEQGMMVRGQMIVGFPGENDETIKETKRFIKSSFVDVFGIHAFQPYPGSDVWNHPDKYGIKIDKETNFSDWHTIGKPEEKLSDERVQKWIADLRETAGQKNIERKM
jgi:anaerobic magnesium-protoporphyrin IX monomethyl ester cyclase